MTTPVHVEMIGPWLRDASDHSRWFDVSQFAALLVQQDASLEAVRWAVVGITPHGTTQFIVRGIHSFEAAEQGLEDIVSRAWQGDVTTVINNVTEGQAVGLTIRRITEVNKDRGGRWHPGFPDAASEWTGSDWSNAMCGEAGEAANVVKKLRRWETGAANAGDPAYDELIKMLSYEIADVFLYLDLLATYYGIDIEAAIIEKFNLTSQKQGFPERLP